MSDIYRDSIFWVEIERIKPNPFQPRREFDQAKLQELSESIRMYGLLQPLTVTKKETPRDDGGISVEYELIAGERRLRASKLAGLQQLPVIIRTGENSDQEKLELAIIENLQREDLNPVDRARAFHDLHKKFGFTHSEIGRKMGKSREYVSNTLRLLSLPESVLAYIAEGRITEGHTRPILMLNDRPEEQAVLIKEILLKKITVRESEMIARRGAQDRVTDRHKIDPNILSVERALTERLGTRVTIEPREVGGRLVISFFSASDLQTLLDSMKLQDERMVVTDAFNGTGDIIDTSDVLVAAVEEAVNAPADPDVQTADEEVRETTGLSIPISVGGVERQEATQESHPGVFDQILGSIGMRPREEDGEQTEADRGTAETLPEAPPVPVGVIPSAERPMPEPMPDEPKDVPDTPPIDTSEEERDLYSVRNFSI